MAPVKVIQVRNNYSPWISDETKKKMEERDLAQKTAEQTKSGDDWNNYKRLRNNVNSVLRGEKKRWQAKKLEGCLEDTSSTWKHVKQFLGWNTGGPPTRLLDNGELVTKPTGLAKTMNQFFIKKVKDLRKSIPVNLGDPLELVRKLMRYRTCSLPLGAFHPGEILEIITKLKSTKSCGLDNIDSYILKLVKHELLPVITHIVNLSVCLLYTSPSPRD